MFYNINIYLHLQGNFLLILVMELRLRHFLTFAGMILGVVFCFGIGFIRISNYPKKEYSGGAQNWNMVQDATGKIYVANQHGLLVFDGIRWKKSYLSNYTTIRSLYYDDESDKIYAGGSEEFGYFFNDSISGQLTYSSLMPFFEKEAPSFSEVWNIMKTGDKLWFQSDNHFFSFDGKKVREYPAPGRITTSSLLGNDIFVALEDGKVLRLEEGSYNILSDSGPLEGKRIVAMLPYGRYNRMMIVTSLDGLYQYDGKKFSELDTPLNDFLSKNQTFCANCKGDVYVFGTVNAGAAVIDFDSGKTDYINKETGLQNNTVLSAGFDSCGNLWLCLDNGLDYASYNSAMTHLLGAGNSIGAGYCSMISGNNIFLGTNQGLFATPFPFPSAPSLPVMKQELFGQIWAMTETSRGLLISSDAGIYHFDGQRFNHVSGVPGTYQVRPVPGNPDNALASTYQGFYILEFADGHWKEAAKLKGCENLAGNFNFNSDGTVWMSHWRKGIYHLMPDMASGSISVMRLYDSQSGLPNDDNNSVAILAGKAVLSTAGGFYTVAPETPSSASADSSLNQAFEDKAHGELHSLSDRSFAYIDLSGIYLGVNGENGEISRKTIANGNFEDLLIQGYVNLNPVSQNEYILSTQDGFNVINTFDSATSDISYSPFISSVYANQDSLVYSSRMKNKESESLDLPYDLNSLKFEFAYPEFDKSANVEFSSYLENYESDWSPFTKESSREFTRLSEGDYVMHLRVHDAASGKMKEVSLGVAISPPWYRTTFAKIIYFISFLIFLGFLIAAVNHRIENARKLAEERKEKEIDELRRQSEKDALVKDYEIASLKTEQLEQDIKHKSQELSSTALNLIQKNEILNDIASQLASLQKVVASETSSKVAIQKNISKLQTSIEKSISGDDNWDAFNKTFDIVYQDYTKRLAENHPNLTNSDKRLCCYLRMGLTSKEIAPLINISSKSVEMARYRLRKKIDLSPEVSLTEYLTSL